MEQEHHNKEDGKQVHLDANLLKFSRDQVNQNITQSVEYSLWKREVERSNRSVPTK